MNYVDGFVGIVTEKNVPAYRELAEAAGKIWKKCGALQYVECIGEDLNPKLPEGIPPEMIGPTFPKIAGAKPGETIIFSYIVFKSRAHRDEVNAKVMKDPYMTDMAQRNKPMPFDPKRMAYGGFTVIVET